MTDSALKTYLNTVIFGTHTPAGKRFDIVLIVFILLSVVVLMLESVASVSSQYDRHLRTAEWFFTIIFTLEYAVRIYCSSNPRVYVRSFYGVVDLVSVLPSYISLIVPGANFLLIVRLLRVLRVFRVFKLVRYLSEANVLVRSMMMAKRKIFIFFMSVLVLATIFGSLMFIVEGPDNGFSSIPKSIYWTIVTITTVGYGDIVPQTVFGQVISAIAMLTGYSIIAVPTGILTAELAHEMQRDRLHRHCLQCDKTGHDMDAKFCRHCGGELPAVKS